MTDIVTRTLAHDECKRLDDAEKQPVKGWHVMELYKSHPTEPLTDEGGKILIFSELASANREINKKLTWVRTGKFWCELNDGTVVPPTELRAMFPVPVGGE